MANDLLKTLTIDGIPMDVAQTNSNPADASTQVATDEFVQNAINRRLPKTRIAAGNSTARNIPNNTLTDTQASLTIPSTGMLILNGYAQFAANATGRRGLTLYVNGGQDAISYVASPSSGVAVVRLSTVFRINTANTVLLLKATQNSGGTLALNSAYLDGYFIPD